MSIINDIAEGIDNGETRNELRRALAIYADWLSEALQANAARMTKQITDELLRTAYNDLDKTTTMTTDQLKSLRAAIDAHLRGEPVQFRVTTPGAEWMDDSAPDLQCSREAHGMRWIVEWRPKPKEPRKLWAVTVRNGSQGFYRQERSAMDFAKTFDGVIEEYVEVIRDAKAD